jgi:HYR domain
VRPRLVVAVALLAGLLVPLASAEPEPPTVTVPPNMTVEATGPTGAVVMYTASARAFNGQELSVTCDVPSGSTFPLGATVVSCSATHGGQTTTARFTVTVADRTPPTVTAPPDKSLRTRSRAGVPVRYTASATDLVDGVVAATCAPPSGTVFTSGTTVVTCSATDRAGNSGRAQFTVTVAIVRTTRAAALFAPPARAVISGPTTLAWRAVTRARFYNVQVYRDGRKILSAWPLRPRYLLRRSWRHQGRTFRLRPGTYTWFVWPAYGTKLSPNFGKLLGQSSFRVV